MSLIIAKNLYKRYAGMPPVLKSIDISVEAGEMVAIMGPSGCGKSTMLHLLGLLHKPDSGSLEIFDTDVMSLDREQIATFRRNNMGFVMQSYNLFDYSTVFENVEFPLIYGNVPIEERWERVIRALELVHLSSRIHYRSNRLSGGEQQRVAIARAMVNSPRILLADEPTGALDAKTSKKIMENFCTLAHDGGVAMVVVTHDNTVAEYCDSIYVLDEGVLKCTKKNILENSVYLANTQNLLSSRTKVMHTACITSNFPSAVNTNATQDILNLYHDNILAKIYSTNTAKLLSFEADESGLPLVIQHINILDLISVKNIYNLPSSERNVILKTLFFLISTNWYNIFTIIGHLRSFLSGIKFAGWAISAKTDHLYAIDAVDSATAALIASQITNIPFSFTLNAGELNKAAATLAFKAEKAAFIRCTTANCLEKAIKLCPNIAPEKFILLRQSLTFADQDQNIFEFDDDSYENSSQLNILSVGDIVKNKGYIDLFKACSIMKAAGLNFKLHIVGEGYLLWYLKFLRLYLKLTKNITFHGQVKHDNLKAILNKSSIYISTNLDTDDNCNLPISLPDAMQWALAIVATNTKNNLEILTHNSNAIIIEQNSPQAIANAIIFLNEDLKFLKNIGEQAQVQALNLFGKSGDIHELSQIILKNKEK